MTDMVRGHDERSFTRNSGKLDYSDLAGEREKESTEGDDQPMKSCAKHSYRE
jgi:hypothetical protein